MRIDRIDRHITADDMLDETACDGSAFCQCEDCCADASQAAFDDYVRGERL